MSPTFYLGFSTPTYTWSVAVTLCAYPPQSSPSLQTWTTTKRKTSALPVSLPCRTFPKPGYIPPLSGASFPVPPRLSALSWCYRRIYSQLLYVWSRGCPSYLHHTTPSTSAPPSLPYMMKYISPLYMHQFHVPLPYVHLCGPVTPGRLSVPPQPSLRHLHPTLVAPQEWRQDLL